MLRSAREQSGLSIRGLAEVAGVSPTTIARIENGHADPSVGTLAKLLDAAGFEWAGTLRRRRAPALGGIRLAQLVTAWSHTPFGDEPDWTALRGALDVLRQHPEELPGALRARPRPSGSAILDSLLAGIAEKLADDAGLPRPSWSARVPPLPHEWIPAGTPRMIARWRAATPPQLRERNLIADEESLWRRADLGVPAGSRA
jgi:transcriptional regulator with XRE-family HTH domain